MTVETYFDWREKVQLVFSKIEKTNQLMQAIEQEARSLGYEYYALYIRHPIPFTRPKTFYYCNFPQNWIDFYFSQAFYSVDPVLHLCHLPGKLWLWDDATAGDGQAVLAAARAYGIYHGVSHSVAAPNRSTGILSFATSNPAFKTTLTTELELKLQYLSVLFLAVLTRLDDISMVSVKLELSEREREILKWMAEGKTSAEISLILSISQHTVNFHQKNMQKRLNATNRTQIASYAAAIGLI